MTQEEFVAALEVRFPLESPDGTVSLQFVELRVDEPDTYIVVRTVIWSIDGTERSVDSAFEHPIPVGTTAETPSIWLDRVLQSGAFALAVLAFTTPGEKPWPVAYLADPTAPPHARAARHTQRLKELTVLPPIVETGAQWQAWRGLLMLQDVRIEGEDCVATLLHAISPEQHRSDDVCLFAFAEDVDPERRDAYLLAFRGAVHGLLSWVDPEALWEVELGDWTAPHLLEDDTLETPMDFVAAWWAQPVFQDLLRAS